MNCKRLLYYIITFRVFLREAAKKSSFLSGQATKRGGGLNGCATKEKRTFFNVRKKEHFFNVRKKEHFF